MKKTKLHVVSNSAELGEDNMNGDLAEVIADYMAAWKALNPILRLTEVRSEREAPEAYAALQALALMEGTIRKRLIKLPCTQRGAFAKIRVLANPMMPDLERGHLEPEEVLEVIRSCREDEFLACVSSVVRSEA